MNVLQVMLHVGLILGMGKDIKQGLADLIAKHPSVVDLMNVLNDAVAMLKSGLFSIPGVSNDEIASVVSEVESQIAQFAAPAAVEAPAAPAAPESAAV